MISKNYRTYVLWGTVNPPEQVVDGIQRQEPVLIPGRTRTKAFQKTKLEMSIVERGERETVATRDENSHKFGKSPERRGAIEAASS